MNPRTQSHKRKHSYEPPDPYWHKEHLRGRKPKKKGRSKQVVARYVRSFEELFDFVTDIRDRPIPQEPGAFLNKYRPYSSLEVDDFIEGFDPSESYLQETTIRNHLLTKVPSEDRIASAFYDEAIILEDLELETPRIGDSNAGVYNMERTQSHWDIPIVIDTGCSLSLTPFAEDFVSKIRPCSVKELRGIGNKVAVKGKGWVEWRVRDVWGHIVVIKTEAYYVPSAKIRLLSPQKFFQESHAGSAHFEWNKVTLTCPDGSVGEFPYQRCSNLPIMLQDHVPTAGLGRHTVFKLTTGDFLKQCARLLDPNNNNLDGNSKELNLWHYRLGHRGFGHIQDLMHQSKQDFIDNPNPPIIPTRMPRTKTIPPPICPACQLSKQTRRTPAASVRRGGHTNPRPIRKQLQPAELISLDNYDSPVLGRLPHTRGKEAEQDKVKCGTIFVDHATQFIKVFHQVSLHVHEALKGKHELEEFCKQFGRTIKGFHADNHPWGSAEFREDCKAKDQNLTMSGVGAHHQNGVAERAQQTVFRMARAMMLHYLVHWPDAFEPDLWPMALDQAVHIWNHTPKDRDGLSPLEHFTGVKLPNNDVLTNSRVFGCPTFVLDPKLQDGKKLPKWKRKSRLGIYLGSSTEHSPTVARVLNPVTGYISPQFHVVFDELFSTVPSLLKEEHFDPATWETLLVNDGLSKTLDQTEGGTPSDFFRDFLDSDSSSVPEGEETDVELSDTESDTDEESEGEIEQQQPVRTRSGRATRRPMRFADLAVPEPPSPEALLVGTADGYRRTVESNPNRYGPATYYTADKPGKGKVKFQDLETAALWE